MCIRPHSLGRPLGHGGGDERGSKWDRLRVEPDKVSLQQNGGDAVHGEMRGKGQQTTIGRTKASVIGLPILFMSPGLSHWHQRLALTADFCQLKKVYRNNGIPILTILDRRKGKSTKNLIEAVPNSARSIRMRRVSWRGVCGSDADWKADQSGSGGRWEM